MRHKQILTKNTRNKYYLRTNSPLGRSIANSKTWTKRILSQASIPVPNLIAKFTKSKEVQLFPWEKLEKGFVVKPTNSSGGEGVWVIKKRAKWAGEWFLVDGTKVSIGDLRLHCLDILQGRYSLSGFPDRVIVEERIKIHPKFLRLTRKGTPDIRVIIYNKIPVMAMLRIPTEESKGKANLHQGALGLGLDLATGITTAGIHYGQPISKIFDLRRKKWIKINGIRVPNWKQVLKIAIQCASAVPGLEYFGADLVIDKEKGPLVLELNARPGLSIQICNQAGLLGRLRRVEGMKVRNEEHATKIAQTIFGESFVDKVKAEEALKIVEVLEPIRIRGEDGRKQETLAKIDTGALRTSIDVNLAKNLGLLHPNNILFRRHYRSSLGRRHLRPVIQLTFWLKGKKIETAANVADRGHLNTPVLIGRRDLGAFLIKPEPVSTKVFR